jgi:hypothetical protein
MGDYELLECLNPHCPYRNDDRGTCLFYIAGPSVSSDGTSPCTCGCRMQVHRRQSVIQQIPMANYASGSKALPPVPRTVTPAPMTAKGGGPIEPQGAKLFRRVVTMADMEKQGHFGPPGASTAIGDAARPHSDAKKTTPDHSIFAQAARVKVKVDTSVQGSDKSNQAHQRRETGKGRASLCSKAESGRKRHADDDESASSSGAELVEAQAWATASEGRKRIKLSCGRALNSEVAGGRKRAAATREAEPSDDDVIEVEGWTPATQPGQVQRSKRVRLATVKPSAETCDPDDDDGPAPDPVAAPIATPVHIDTARSRFGSSGVASSGSAWVRPIAVAPRGSWGDVAHGVRPVARTSVRAGAGTTSASARTRLQVKDTCALRRTCAGSKVKHESKNQIVDIDQEVPLPVMMDLTEEFEFEPCNSAHAVAVRNRHTWPNEPWAHLSMEHAQVAARHRQRALELGALQEWDPRGTDQTPHGNLIDGRPFRPNNAGPGNTHGNARFHCFSCSRQHDREHRVMCNICRRFVHRDCGSQTWIDDLVGVALQGDMETDDFGMDLPFLCCVCISFR